MIPTMYWLGLSHETRKKIAILLEIPRSGHTEVVDNRVVSDGYTPIDLAVVTLEKLQIFMQNKKEDNFMKLFEQLVKNVELPLQEIGSRKEKTETVTSPELNVKIVKKEPKPKAEQKPKAKEKSKK